MLYHSLNLVLLPETFAVCKLNADTAILGWMTEGAVFSITRTPDELSIVCEESLVPEGVTCERSWRCLRVAGTMSFSMVGVLASLVQPLATAGVSAFAVSTFDTDYILVKETDLEKARQALREAQHVLSQR